MRKKKAAVAVTILVLATLFAFLYVTGEVYYLNPIFNQLVAGEPRKDCLSDSDCVYKQIDCEVCGQLDAVNKNWEPFCLIPDTRQFFCAASKMIPERNIKCMGGVCQFAQ
jgi:hypothetical protein